MSQQMSLFLGCWVQTWYFIASLVTVRYGPLRCSLCAYLIQWYTIDRVGRRKLWITMAIGQMILLVLEAACVAIDNPASGAAAVCFIFLYETCFTWGT